MRLRNIKNAKEKVNNNPLVINKNIFDSKNELHIEIGMGKGDFIINKALLNPGINFIGIEKYESVLVRALEKVPRDVNNLKFMCIDALTIGEYFNHDVDKIYLNFSDPWPKKRHSKRRLTSEVFLPLYEKISKNNVNIEIKTDNKDLFAYTLKNLNNNGYTFEDVSLDLPSDYEGNIETEYERKFRSKNISINYLKSVKKMK